LSPFAGRRKPALTGAERGIRYDASMNYEELFAEYQRMQYSHQMTADELAKTSVENIDLRSRVDRLEVAGRGVTECEDDLEDAILALRAVVDECRHDVR
jgi:hypothetical protein